MYRFMMFSQRTHRFLEYCPTEDDEERLSSIFSRAEERFAPVGISIRRMTSAEVKEILKGVEKKPLLSDESLDHAIRVCSLTTRGSSCSAAIYARYVAEHLIMDINEAGYGVDLIEGENELFLAVGMPQASGEDQQFCLNHSSEPFVFIRTEGNPATEEELRLAGLSEVFYRIRFLSAEDGSFPWRFLLNFDTIEVYQTCKSEENCIGEAAKVIAALEDLLESARMTPEWRIDPVFTDFGCYLGLAMVPGLDTARIEEEANHSMELRYFD